MAGAVGNAILFFFFAAGVVVMGLWALSYGAHCFLVVLESTAAGDDDLRWPDDPMFDWLWKFWYLAWLLAFWLVPLWFLIDGVVAPAVGVHGVGFYPLLVGAIWLLFPLSLFSSLSASSRWIVFRPAVLGRLARHGFAVLVVYLMAGLLVVGAGALAYFALFSRSWLLLPPATLVGSAVLLVHARLFGRLAWLVMYRTAEKPGKRRKKRKRTEGAKALDESGPPSGLGSPPPAGAGLFPQFNGTEEEEEDWRRPAKPYGLAKESPDPQPRAAPRRVLIEAEEEAYAVHPEAAPSAPVPLPLDGNDPVSGPRSPGVARDESPAETERAAARRKLLVEKLLRPREPDPPAHPLWTGVYTFPWYPSSMKAWIYLSLTGLVLGAFVRGMLLTWPF